MSRSLAVLVLVVSIFAACKKEHMPKVTLPTEPQECLTEPGYTAVLTGSVVTDYGVPIPNARITLGTHTASADQMGNFRINDLFSGPGSIVVEAAGHTTANGGVVVVGGINTMRAVLGPDQRADVLFGRVLDSCSGQPIAGAQIGPAANRTATAADGTYVLNGCCFSTTTDFTVRKDGYKTVTPQLIRNVGSNAHDWLMERAF